MNSWPAGMVVTDVETDGLYASAGHRPFLLGAEDEDGTTFMHDLTGERALDEAGPIREAVERPDVVKVAHNAKFEIEMYTAMGWRCRGRWLDTMQMSPLHNEYEISISLKYLSEKYLGEEYLEADIIKNWLKAERRQRRAHMRAGLKAEGVADRNEREAAVNERCREPTFRDFYTASWDNQEMMLSYLQKDLDCCLRLAWMYLPEMRRTYAKSFRVEMALPKVVARMEAAGLPVDVGYAGDKRDEYLCAASVEADRMFGLAGRSFNPNSPQQLLRVLRDNGIDVPNTRKQTLGGLVSGGAEGGLRDTEPIVASLLEYRANAKVAAFFDSLLEHEIDGLVHAQFWQNGQHEGIKTGRFSITEPGLQTLPGGYRGTVGERGRDVRRAIVPVEGYDLFMLDFAQVEPRVLAHYSGDERILEAVATGRDIYAPFVEIFFDLDEATCPPKLWKQRRSDAKTIILAITYGMGVGKLARDLGVPAPEAKGMRAKCFREMPSMARAIRDAGKDLVQRGHVTCLFGRWYRVPKERSYKAINAKVQGGAAGVMKRALLDADQVVLRWNRGRRRRARMLLTIHDEVIFLVPKGGAPELVPLLVDAMESCSPELSVPLKVDVEWSDVSWGDKTAWPRRPWTRRTRHKLPDFTDRRRRTE